MPCPEKLGQDRGVDTGVGHNEEGQWSVGDCLGNDV